MKRQFVVLTPENAEAFFRTCLEKEAVTEVERLKILAEMAEDNKVMMAGELDDKSSKAVSDYFEKTHNKSVILLKESEQDHEENNGC